MAQPEMPGIRLCNRCKLSHDLTESPFFGRFVPAESECLSEELSWLAQEISPSTLSSSEARCCQERAGTEVHVQTSLVQQNIGTVNRDLSATDSQPVAANEYANM